MASRYERVCLIEKLHNNPDVKVELLAGAILRDNLANGLRCQLKFRVIGKYAAQKVSICVSCFDANENQISQTTYTYDSGPYEPDTDCGTDILIEIPNETATVEVTVCSAVYDNPVQLTIFNRTPSKMFQSGTIYIGEHQDDGSVVYSSSLERGELCTLSVFPGSNTLDFMIYGLGTSSVTFDIINDATLIVAFNYKSKCYEVTSETPNSLRNLKTK